MSHNVFPVASSLSMPESIREDEINHSDEEIKGDNDSDLLFGSLEDEIHSRSSIDVHRQTSLTKEQIVEKFIGIANIRAKYRSSKVGSTDYWKGAARKTSDLVDPWYSYYLFNTN